MSIWSGSGGGTGSGPGTRLSSELRGFHPAANRAGSPSRSEPVPEAFFSPKCVALVPRNPQVGLGREHQAGRGDTNSGTDQKCSQVRFRYSHNASLLLKGPPDCLWRSGAEFIESAFGVLMPALAFACVGRVCGD